MTNDSPLKRQLQHVIMLTSLMSLLLACAGFVIYDYITFKHFMINDLSTLARMLAVNVQSALIFEDAEAAESTLSSLRSRGSITSAGIYRSNRTIFATYVRPGTKLELTPSPDKLSHHFERGRLTVYANIVANDRAIGVVFLESELEKLYARVRTYVEIALLLLVLSGFTAYFVSIRLQKRVSEPVVELAQTARVVSEKNDFSVRAKKRADDEIGLLADTFNQMLAQIQERDQALRHSNDALTKLNQDLEQRVQNRTDALKESNEQMQVFTYSVAHDLRAPLRSIKGFSEAVLEDYGPRLEGDALTYLDRVIKSVDHMDMIIQDLLSYSTLSRDELTLTTVNLRQVIDNALNFQTADIQSTRAEITIHEPILPVTGHAATIENMVTNLISNAIKYVSPGTAPRINIRTECAGKAVRLWVEDHGIGIAPEYHEKIFGVFSRLHTAAVYSGTGIGLAIVRKGAERLNGRCGVDSAPGKGSRFWIELPAP